MRRTLAIALAAGLLFLGGCDRMNQQPASLDLTAVDTLLVEADAADDGAAAQAGTQTKEAVEAKIDKRLDALKQYDATIGAARQLTAAHKDTLTKLVAGQRAGLTALKTKVQGETTAEGVRADAQTMVNGYRVFLLTGPKVRLTAAIDTELAVAAKLRADAVGQSLAGKADALLAIEPGPDADAITGAVAPVRQAAKTARTDLKALRKTK